MNNELIAALAVAACAGLTTLAYNKPAEFRRIGYPLAVICVIFGIGITIWGFSSAEAVKTLDPFIGLGQKKAAQAAVDAITPPLWLLLTIQAASAYNAFLLWLPNILGKADK